MKIQTLFALALAASLTTPLAALAQTAEAPLHHHQVHRFHGPHHTVHHRFTTHGQAAPVAQRPGEAVETPSPPANQMFKPYAHPGEGDDDGLSRDPDDCMKGCIGGNPG